ncbi:G1/S-specific cyclin-E [Gryllus bimaculatus]|nr:G1/S-specific cyclin-E [Gryllus bimaculatus]
MDMELFCAERLQDSQIAERDPTIFEDMRVLQNLLDLESLYIPSCNYFETIQKDLQPFMRKVVTTWMLEVCEEQRCEDQVFPLAVNLLDRFLCACAISRRQLQLAGAVCLLLASKVRQCHALSVDLLCAYTDHSITPADMRSWELLVLGKLRWEAVAVTGYDVADHVLARLSTPASAPPPLRLHPLTRQHAITLVGFCYVEPEFIQSPPSLLAAASICAAVRGLHPGASTHVLSSMARTVCAITRADPQATEAVIRHIERALAAEVANQQQQLPPQAAPLPGYTPAPGAALQPTASAKMAGVVPEESEVEEDRQPETPIDVQDVHF